MYRKVASSELQHVTASRGRVVRHPVRRKAERWPRAITLPLAVMTSLALWAAMIGGVMVLFAP
jgi:hypothetical protein